MSSIRDDELTLLWRLGTSSEPAPEEVARLAGRASLRRFDRMILRRNFREYTAGLVLFFAIGWDLLLTGDDRALDLIGFVCMSFVLGYLWWHQRHLTPLDRSADARAYHAAMLSRIDTQIRLLRNVRYWALIPGYIPGLWMVVKIVYTQDKSGLFGPQRPIAAMLYLAFQTVFFVWISWLNERSRWGIPCLQAERTKIERLYEE